MRSILATVFSSSSATPAGLRSEEHTSELQSRETISYAVFCLKKKDQRLRSAPRATCCWARAYSPFNSVRCETRSLLFFFNDTATTEIYPLSLHAALPISPRPD